MLTTKKIKIEQKLYPLHAAAKAGKHIEVERLLDNGYDVNSFDGNYETPLQIAIKNVDFPLVKILVRRGADINRYKFLEHPFLEALKSRKRDIIRFLIMNGLDLTKRYHGDMPIHYSIRMDDSYSLEYIVSGCQGLTEKDSKGRTPSELAAEFGYDDLQKIILDGIKECHNKLLLRSLTLMTPRVKEKESYLHEDIMPLDIFNYILDLSGLPTAKRDDIKDVNRND